MENNNKNTEVSQSCKNDVNERLYSMLLHEQIELNDGMINWNVTRVASGWIYSYVRLDMHSMVSTFVPYDNAFQNAR